MLAIGFLILGGLGGMKVTISSFGHVWQMSLSALLGALIAFVFLIVGNWLLAPGTHLLRLDPDNPSLRELTNEFRKTCFKHKFSVRSFFERSRLWFFLVVPYWSADPGITDGKVEGIKANHIQICKKRDEELQKAVTQFINDAGRGVSQPVFERSALTKGNSKASEAYDVLNKAAPNDKGKADENFRQQARRDRGVAEKDLRTCVRERMRQGNFLVNAAEQELALISPFDVDRIVLSLWHEHEFGDGLRKLRDRAKVEVEKNLPTQSDRSESTPPTLIPLYRSLRTIEHLCASDLDAPGEVSTSDRDLLLEVIGEAEKGLAKWCPTLKWKDTDGKEQSLDEDGRTRLMLLRMSFMLRAIESVQQYVGREALKERGKELAAVLQKRRLALDNALSTFTERLKS